MLPIKYPLVNCMYPEDLCWIDLKRLEEWDWPERAGFAYDEIKDEEIIAYLVSDKSQLDVDISIEWQDDKESLKRNEWKTFHAKRIAALVREMTEGKPIKPVELDTFANVRCPSCIVDGHHRIRALQYLGFEKIPAYCSGLVEELEFLGI